MYFAHLVIKSLISRTNVQGSNIWIFIHSLNDSNLKLIFICLQFQISILNDQKSQSSPRFSGHIVFLCPVIFSLLTERKPKIWQITNEIFYIISWDSSQIYGCRLRDIMIQKWWARNKTVFSPFLLQGSTISIYSHRISSHCTFFSPKAINLNRFMGKSTPDAMYTLLAFCSSLGEPLISHMNGSQHVLT